VGLNEAMRRGDDWGLDGDWRRRFDDLWLRTLPSLVKYELANNTLFTLNIRLTESRE